MGGDEEQRLVKKGWTLAGRRRSPLPFASLVVIVLSGRWSSIRVSWGGQVPRRGIAAEAAHEKLDHFLPCAVTV